MKAIVATQIGDWRKVLALQDLPALEIPDGCVKIRVHAAGVCFPDALQIEGKHVMSREAPFVPASEVSGEVVTVGAGVAQIKVGDVVFGTCITGALATEAVMRAQDCFAVPQGVDPNMVAGFEVNYGTAYHGLIDIAGLREGQTVLVLGASGGVGMAAIDIAKAVGAKVVACASTDAKLQQCKVAGADCLLNYVTEGGGDFKKALKDAGLYGSIDVVWDPVGGAFTEVAFRAMGFGGRLVVVGFASGGAVPKNAIPSIPANLALLNERQMVGCLWGAWKMMDGGVQNRRNVEEMMNMLNDGRLNPVISATYDFSNYQNAFQDIMGRQVIGKVTVRPVLPSPKARL